MHGAEETEIVKTENAHHRDSKNELHRRQRALHACGSVTDAPPSALLWEIREMGNQRMNDRTKLVFGDKNVGIQWRVKARNSLRQAKNIIGKTRNVSYRETQTHFSKYDTGVLLH